MRTAAEPYANDLHMGSNPRVAGSDLGFRCACRLLRTEVQELISLALSQGPSASGQRSACLPCCRHMSKQSSDLAWLLVLGSPGLLVVDHIHFQYNGMLLGELL